MKKALTVLFAVLVLALVAIPVSTAMEKTPAGSIACQADDPDGCVWVDGMLICY